MQQRLPSRLDPPIAFAHRGASAHAPENTIKAFQLALRLGATGLESDVWVTADDVAVLDHDGVVRRGIRRKAISETLRRDLPDHIPTIEEVLTACGTSFELSLDLKEPDALDATVGAIRDVGDAMAGRTWLCDASLDRLIARRADLADFKLVHSSRLERLNDGPERHAARLADAGIDAMNMHRSNWNGGLVVLFHRFDRLAFSWDLQFDHQLEPAIRMGMDAVYSNHVDVMMDVLSKHTGII